MARDLCENGCDVLMQAEVFVADEVAADASEVDGGKEIVEVDVEGVAAVPVFVMIDRSRRKPWTTRSGLVAVLLASSWQSWRRMESFCWTTLSFSVGALIVRVPPWRLRMVNVVYFAADESL